MGLKKKSIYSILIILITIFSMQKSFAIEDTNIDSVINQSMNIHHYTDSNGILYEYDTNHSTASIIDYLGTEKKITIPTSIIVEENSYMIKTIEDWAFSRKELIDVKIPDSITNIGNWTFYKNNLTSIVIPNSVVTIGNGAFNQNALTNLDLSNSITSLESNVFSDNQLTNIEIPNSVKTIGVSSFSNNMLTDVHIPNSVTMIRERAFTNNQLSNIIIPNSVISIEAAVFENNQLHDILIPSSISHIGNWCFMGNPLQTIYTDNGNTNHLKNILNASVMLEIKADTTVILESPPTYASNVALDNTISIGKSISLDAKQQIKYVYTHGTATWKEHIPTIQWFKDGQPLLDKTELTLTITNIDEDDAGIYYAVIDSIVLPDIRIEIINNTSQLPNDDVNKPDQEQEDEQIEGIIDDIQTGDQTKGITLYVTGGIATLTYMIFLLLQKVRN